MKKILGLFIIGFSFFGCIDEDILDGPAMAFYPTIAIEAVEQDTTQYLVVLEATGKLNGDAAITIKFDNYEFIETVPAHTNGVLKVEVGSEGTAEFTVEALNDDFPESYIATFRVTDTEGAVTGIVNSTLSFIVQDDDVASVFFEDFETNGLSDWETEVIGAGDDWSTGDFSGNTYADISNFNANEISESWLISKKIDFVSEENEVLIFETQARFNEGGEIFTAYIITGYTPGMNPTDATLTELTFERDPHEGGGFGNFTTSGAIDLSHIDEVGRIAFYYKAESSSDGSGWSIDNVTVQSFDPNNSGPEPEPTTFSIPFSDDLNACSDFSIPSNFIQERIPGSKQDRGWECSGNGMSGSQAVRASAAGGVAGTVDAWLISAKAFDLGATSMATLSFDAKSPAAGSGELNILWSSDYTGMGDPSSATWTEFAGVILPAGGVDVYAEIEVDIADATGSEAYIAFQFVGGTNSSSTSYDIDNISVSSGSGGGGGGSCPGTMIVSHDFEGCSADFSIPDGFIEENVPGSKTDRGWGCRDDGTGGSRAVRGSAFGGEDGIDDAWLIMDAIDATPYSEICLKFDVQSLFSGPGDLLVFYSTNYSGSGDPSSATWTQLTDVTSQLPAQGSSMFATVITTSSDISGSSVYFAFQYVNGTSGDSSSWSIDNLELRGN